MAGQGLRALGRLSPILISGAANHEKQVTRIVSAVFVGGVLYNRAGPGQVGDRGRQMADILGGALWNRTRHNSVRAGRFETKRESTSARRFSESDRSGRRQKSIIRARFPGTAETVHPGFHRSHGWR